MSLLTRLGRRRDERGGVAVTVGVLFSAGVVLGAAALVVDVGQLYVEREQLQSGADAAALAVARSCALDPANCTDPMAIAVSYANHNAKDGASAVTVVCGTVAGLPACPPEPPGLPACIGTPAAGTTYVDVRTATLQSNGSTLLPPTFARGIAGNGGYQGKRLTACARVGYKTAVTAITKAVMVPVCEWQQATAGGISPPPSEAPGQAKYEAVFHQHGTGVAAPGCAPPADTVPGGYDWLPDDASVCHTHVHVGDTFTAKDTGQAEHDCDHGLTVSRQKQLVLIFALYDSVTKVNGRYTYHIGGLAPFVVTGFSNINGDQLASTITGQNYCDTSTSCLYGYFTRELLPTDSSSTAPSYGASVVGTIG